MTVRAIRDNTTKRVDLETLDAIATVLGCASGDLLVEPGGKRRGGGGRSRTA
jgi:DNA-binding Xre family transcriptional regulator